MNFIIDKILTLLLKKQTIFVAIDGIPGSGKTTLSKIIKKKIPAVKIVKVDDFYSTSIGNTDFDRFKNQVFIPLKSGKLTCFKIYNWELNSSNKIYCINPNGIIIIEGTSSMDRRLVDLYDYRIWVDCPTQIGLNRVLKRDDKKYHKLWKEKWIPQILDFIDKQKPYKKADIVINYDNIHE